MSIICCDGCWMCCAPCASECTHRDDPTWRERVRKRGTGWSCNQECCARSDDGPDELSPDTSPNIEKAPFVRPPCPSCATLRAENERLRVDLADAERRCSAFSAAVTRWADKCHDLGLAYKRLRIARERLLDDYAHEAASFENERAILARYLDQPEDRLWHAEDGTWWRRDDSRGLGTLVRAEPPPRVAEMEKQCTRWMRRYLRATGATAEEVDAALSPETKP